MFGLLRTILALLVMAGHLLDTWQIGTYAVFGFYMISGYLMTHIMHESYGFHLAGRWSFACNRFLRLYPLYWCAALITILLIIVLGKDYVSSYNASIFLPETLTDYWANITMVYPLVFANEYQPILVPTTWAITVELFFYAAICLGLSKTKFRVQLWLVISILYVMYCLYQGLGWRYRYFPILAGSLPFAMGAYIYFLKQDAWPRLEEWLFQPVCLLFGLFVNMLLVVGYDYYFEMGFYVNAFFCVLLCYQIANGALWPKISARLDKLLGEFSYPIYLLQWQAGIVASYILLGEPIHNASTDGIAILGLALLFVFVVAYVLIRVIDRPIQNLRSTIKNQLVLKDS